MDHLKSKDLKKKQNTCCILVMIYYSKIIQIEIIKEKRCRRWSLVEPGASFPVFSPREITQICLIFLPIICSKIFSSAMKYTEISCNLHLSLPLKVACHQQSPEFQNSCIRHIFASVERSILEASYSTLSQNSLSYYFHILQILLSLLHCCYLLAC